MTAHTDPPDHPLWPATTDELAAATAGRLDQASDREVDGTLVLRAVPPERLDVGQAMHADAQCQLGLPRTATPQQSEQHRCVRAPALRLGIAIARSSSMNESNDNANAASWVIGAAADTARQAQSTIAIVTFDTDANLVDTNSTSHTRLPGAANHSANLPDALELLRRRLKLDLHPDDSRLLVVISDSAPANLEHVERNVAGLAESGARVLWVSIDEDIPANLPAGITPLGVSSTDLMRTLPDTFNDILAALTAGGYQDRAQPR